MLRHQRTINKSINSSLSAFLHVVPLPFLSVFLAYPSFVFSVHVSLPAALLRASLSPLRFICYGRLSFFFLLCSLVSIAVLHFLLLPSGCFCSLVTCFAFLSVFSPGLCSALSRFSCSLAWSFIAAVLFLLCFPDCVSHFLFMCILLVIVSSAFSCLFLFSMLSVVSGVSVLRLLDFPWGLSHAFRVLLLFFSISLMF